MRTIADHKLNELNDALTITVLDEPGQGGACHEYEIDQTDGAPESGGAKTLIRFQNGPIAEHGVNGISNEALLAIVIDRLRCFDAGPYRTDENLRALETAVQSLEFLQARTRERMARNVEGTSQK